MITTLDFEIDTYARLAAGRLRADPGYHAIQVTPGWDPILGAVFVAQIGDVTPRFHRPTARLLAGADPKHDESDTTVHRGRITEQGSTLVRWAALEAVQKVAAHTRLGQVRERVGERRGRNIDVVTTRQRFARPS